MAHEIQTRDRQTDKQQRKTQYTMSTIQDVQYNTVKLIKTQTDSHIEVVSPDHYNMFTPDTQHYKLT